MGSRIEILRTQILIQSSLSILKRGLDGKTTLKAIETLERQDT